VFWTSDENLRQAIEAFNKALELHPKSGAALCGLALCKFYEAASAKDVDRLEKSFELIQKAASVDYANTSILGKGKILGERILTYHRSIHLVVYLLF
jgi:hypothetical protein